MLTTSISVGYRSCNKGRPSMNESGITSPCGVEMDGEVPNLGDQSSTVMP